MAQYESTFNAIDNILRQEAGGSQGQGPLTQAWFKATSPCDPLFSRGSIPAHSFIQLRVGNPDVNKLRIAYADCENQKVDYVTIQACNTLFKQTIEYEDDTRWIYPIRKTLNDEAGEIMYYESLDMETFVPTRLTKEQLRQIKK